MIQTASIRDKNWLYGSKITKSFLLTVFNILFTLSMIFSCRQAAKSPLPDAAGTTGEVLVVMYEDQWTGEAGEALRRLLSVPYEILPQHEPVFDYFHVNPPDFREFLLLHRNIILADINPEYNDSLPVYSFNGRAHNQLEIIIKTPDLQSFNKIIKNNGREILSKLEDMERKRFVNVFAGNINSQVTGMISEKHNISLIIPQDWDIALDTTGFTWLLKESGTILQGIFIYSWTTMESRQLTAEKIIHARDSLLREYVRGSSDNSYMTTEPEFPPLLSCHTLIDSLEIAELRGLWKTVNGISMGGPFMSISFTGQENTLTTVEGFVYAAGYNKRDYMREVESIVLSAGP